MKSKNLLFVLLRLFSVIYAAIYTIPTVVSSLSVFTSERMMGMGNQMIPYSLILISVIAVPIIIWFSADKLSSKIIQSKEESENYLPIPAADLLSVAIMIVGLIFAVKSLPIIISILYSKIFYGGSVNPPYSLYRSMQTSSGNELLKSIIDFIIGDILMIFNKDISGFMNNLIVKNNKDT